MSQRQHNEDRMRRADSWLQRGEVAENDYRFPDYDKFIFLWIAFDAAYGGDGVGERNRICKFVGEILGNKSKNKDRIHELLWNDLRKPILNLVSVRYVYEPFWCNVRRGIRGGRFKNTWRKMWEEKRGQVENWLDGRTRPDDVLEEVLMRLYTLRNQIFHGGTTYSVGDETTPPVSKGREQVRQGVKVMKFLMPEILNDPARGATERARSWLRRSEAADHRFASGERFTSLWIAFNAAYGRETNDKDATKIDEFLKEVQKRDKENRVGKLSESIKELRGLRNRILHGNMNCQEAMESEEVLRGARTMECLVPKILEVMREDINKDENSKVWGVIEYPNVDGQGKVCPRS